jgi:hypothetical protein
LFTACDIHAINVSEGNGALDKAIKENEMKKSYVKEEALQIQMDIDLGEVAQLIDVLQDVVNDTEDGASNNWKAKDRCAS